MENDVTDFSSNSFRGEDYYFMEAGDPRPAGTPVQNIVGVMASSGGNDMIYYVTSSGSVALMGSESAKYAGGSGSSTASAYLTFAILSTFDKAAHEPFPPGAAVKIALPCRWKDGENWVNGDINAWIAAGYPTTGFEVVPPITVLGVK